MNMNDGIGNLSRGWGYSIFVLVFSITIVVSLSAHADYDQGMRAWESGNFREAISEWMRDADSEDGRAMLAIGRAYRQGLGVLQNFVEAYKWFNLAASRGISEAIKERDEMATEMTVSERSEARTLARQWHLGGGTAIDEVEFNLTEGEFQDCDICPAMVVVPAGDFMMGSPMSEEARDVLEGLMHRVTIRQDFAIGKYEVTFREWDACVSDRGCWHRANDVGWGRGNRPVINVSWEDAQEYVRWLSRKTGKTYRLPSESEWEYAARAGSTGPFHFGSTISTEQANYNGDYTYGEGTEGVYREQTVPVGSFPANGFGLHDVHGNVWEWVEDCWHSYLEYFETPSDGSAWNSGDCRNRLLRGGSWGNLPRFL